MPARKLEDGPRRAGSFFASLIFFASLTSHINLPPFSILSCCALRDSLPKSHSAPRSHLVEDVHARQPPQVLPLLEAADAHRAGGHVVVLVHLHLREAEAMRTILKLEVESGQWWKPADESIGRIHGWVSRQHWRCIPHSAKPPHTTTSPSLLEPPPFPSHLSVVVALIVAPGPRRLVRPSPQNPGPGRSPGQAGERGRTIVVEVRLAASLDVSAVREGVIVHRFACVYVRGVWGNEQRRKAALSR